MNPIYYGLLICDLEDCPRDGCKAMGRCQMMDFIDLNAPKRALFFRAHGLPIERPKEDAKPQKDPT